jgi:hypothetical protein
MSILAVVLLVREILSEVFHITASITRRRKRYG